MSVTKSPPQLDARLGAAAAFVRPGCTVADIGCDHGKLSASLAATGRCKRVIACEISQKPLRRAQKACAPWSDTIEFRFGDGLTVLKPGEVDDIVIAGMGAQTILDILLAAPWVRDERYNFVLVPATKHTLLRWRLLQNGFALVDETLVCVARRWYAVMNARYTGQCLEPDLLWCLTGAVQGQPGAAQYRAWQCGKLKKYRRGVQNSAEAHMLDNIIAQMEDDTLWPCSQNRF